MAKKDKVSLPAAAERSVGTASDAATAPVVVRPQWSSQDWLLLAVIILASFLLHVWRLQIPNEQIFDEVYHARTAQEYLNGLEPYEWTHPPLGKLLIAIGVWAFGFNGFGFRIVPCIWGALSVGVLYILALHLFRNRAIALLSALLINMDGVFFVQSRVAMTNIFVYAFQLLGWLFMWRYLKRQGGLAGRPGQPPGWLQSNDFNLCMAGVGYGLAIATRWSANFLLAGFLVWLVADRLRDYHEELATERIKGRQLRYLERLARLLPWGTMALNTVVLPYLLVTPYLLYLSNERFYFMPPSWARVLFILSLPPLLWWLARQGGSHRPIVPGVPWFYLLPLVLGVLFRVSDYFHQPEWIKWNHLVLGMQWDFLWLYLGYTLPLFAFLLKVPSLRWASRLVFYLLFIPSAIYLLTYIPWLQQQHNVWEVMWKQKDMWGYHANLNAAHPYYSPWWSWPWVARPTWYYYAHNAADDMVWGIDAIGNPAIWWASVPAMFILIFMIGARLQRVSRAPVLGSLVLSMVLGVALCAAGWMWWILRNSGGTGVLTTNWDNYRNTFNIPSSAYFFEFIPFVLLGATVWALLAELRLAGREDRELFPSPLLFILIGFAVAWLPWGTSPRQRIYMHYIFEAIPFACMALSYLIYVLWDSPRSSLGNTLNRYLVDYWGPLLPESVHQALVERQAGQALGRWLAGTYLVVTVALFWFFYPMVSAYPMRMWYYHWHIWPLPWANWI